MVKCFDCKYLKKGEKDKDIPIGKIKSGPISHQQGVQIPKTLGEYPPEAEDTVTISGRGFTCTKINEILLRHGFEKVYPITESEVNKDRDCEDFEKE